MCLPDIPGLFDTHYESGRKIFFCSVAHHETYRYLKEL